MGLYPTHLDTGATSMAVGGDVFGKWAEGAPLTKLDLFHTTVWLHDELVFRYGTPLAVCMDRGLEYCATFSCYCKLAGI